MLLHTFLQALYLSPDSGYHIVWPISYGEMNVTERKGYTLTNIIQSLYTLWTAAVHKHLGIDEQQLQV